MKSLGKRPTLPLNLPIQRMPVSGLARTCMEPGVSEPVRACSEVVSEVGGRMVLAVMVVMVVRCDGRRRELGK